MQEVLVGFHLSPVVLAMIHVPQALETLPGAQPRASLHLGRGGRAHVATSPLLRPFACLHLKLLRSIELAPLVRSKWP